MSAPQVSRRSVARGAAWSVPLVAVGVAAPAFAASQGLGPTVTAMSGCRCGVGGGPVKPYRFDVTFNNATTSTFAITAPDVVLVGDFATGEQLQTTTPAQTNEIPPGSKTLHYTFNRGGNPSADLVTFNYVWTNTTTNLATPGTITLSVNWSLCTNTCQG